MTWSDLKVQPNLHYVDVVKDFGAKGNGVNDDTAAIQAAVNNLAGRILFFPAGTYKISASIVVSNPSKITGSGHIGALANTGTLIWQTIAAPVMILDSGACDSIVSDFELVSEGDGILALESHRNTFRDIRISKGTRGYGMILDGSYSNRLYGCVATTNGNSSFLRTTGYAGHMLGGFRLIKGLAAFGANASELHSCEASCGGYGLYIGDVVDTYANVFGGTFQGNDHNIYMKTVTGGVTIQGAHLESPAISNITLENVANVTFSGSNAYGVAPGNKSVVLINSSECYFKDALLGYVSIDATSINNIFENIGVYRTSFLDNGIGTITKNLREGDQSYLLTAGDVALNGSQNLALNGRFDNRAGGILSGCNGVAQDGTVTKETVITRFGVASAKMTSNGLTNYSGIIYSGLQNQLYSPFLTVSFW